MMLRIKERSGRASEQVGSLTLSIEQVEREVTERGEEIKRMVDRQTADLLRELNVHKTSNLKNFERDMEGLRMNMMICDSFKQFCTKVVEDADSVEFVRVADELKTRAEEVKLLSLPEVKTLPRIIFIPSIGINRNQDNIVGKLSRI